MAGKLRVEHPGAIDHVMNRGELAHRRKGDPGKIQIARRLRAETTMMLAWIARNLSMGAPGSLANCLRNNPP